MRGARLVLQVGVALVAAAAIGCPPRVKPGSTPILQPVPPPGTPTSRPAGGPSSTAPAGSDQPLAAALPLPPSGHNSEAQLDEERARLTDPAQRAAFEQAFRLTFTTDRSARDPARVRELLRPLTGAGFAPAWRVVGYTYVDDGFQVDQAVRCYEQAVAADESYGPAHYALAFMLGQSDPTKGRHHFERARALGVEDQRKLGERFYR